MSGADTVIFSSAVVAAIAAVGVGLAAFWANPQRAMNRAFFTGSLHVAAWAVCLHFAFSVGNPDEGLVWVKRCCLIGAFLPLHIFIIQQTLTATLPRSLGYWMSSNWWWVVISVVLGVIPFTDVFIPAHSRPEARVRGWGFYFYIVANVGLYAWLLRDALRTVKTVGGVRRLELKVWMSGVCVIGVTVFVLMVLGAVTQNPNYTRVQPMIVFVFYAGTAFAITTHRIFDARQILLLALEKFLLVGLVALFAYWVDWGFVQLMPEQTEFAFFATTAIALWFAVTLSERLDRIFQFYPQATGARQAIFAVAQRETRADSLVKAFCAVLKGWGQTENAMILSGTKNLLSGGGIELSGDSAVISAMQQLRWATPERLARERTTPDRLALDAFLAERNLGVLVMADGPALTALVGVGMGASRRPFTYPQVTQLMELAAIIEATLERAHFSSKVQHAEQLATVGLLGASLAHEIRNPLVSIKTFVQLLPTHYQDPVFRTKFFRLIGDEVGRIDQLTEQLLDLASPRTYVAKEIELHPVLQASLDLVAAKAADRNVEFRMELKANPDRAYTDASAAKQVMLNLCFNAIQAIDSRPTEERWVKIATRNTDGGIEMVIADSGPGIAPEIRSRLFQPFQTTKSTGFGLGLAICSDILANLNASISVDPPEVGQGASFRITFPCQPSLS